MVKAGRTATPPGTTDGARRHVKLSDATPPVISYVIS